MTDEGADKKNSCRVLSCVPGSLLEAGDTRVSKRVKNPSSQVMLRQVNRLSDMRDKCKVLRENMRLSLDLTQAWGSVGAISWRN